jgi:serine/threonine protein phosphatase PrpC
MSSHDAVDFVHKLRHVNRRLDATFLAQALVYRASQLKSSDNIAVILILFKSDKDDPSGSVEAPAAESRAAPVVPTKE